MSKSCFVFSVLAATLLVAGLSASAETQVLYVTWQSSQTQSSISTYNVDPKTAVATEVGSPIYVAVVTVDPLTVGHLHVLYLWNSTDVWLYHTAANGGPDAKASQHVVFNFAHPVTTFLADPRGKFAYACMTWVDTQGNNYASVVLFKIDPNTGKLTNTRKIVAAYGPNLYIYLGPSFNFGVSGRWLFVSTFNNGPYTCDPGYDSYQVNLRTGALGPLTEVIEVGADCGGTASAAVSDRLDAAQSTCCGPGSGYVAVTDIHTQQQISCGPSMLLFCGDDGGPWFDPASKNLFFSDADLNQVDVGHIDFAGLKLLQTKSLIPGNPPLYFSPDSRLVYAVQPEAVNIYTFDPNTGELGTNVPLFGPPGVTLATTILPSQ